MAGAKALYGLHELAYRTQYAELKERASAAGNLQTARRHSGTGAGAPADHPGASTRVARSDG